MNFDLRFPIGIMFSLFGLILTIYGFISDQAIYDQHSLGININVRWGAVLLVFGVLMLVLAFRGSAAAKSEAMKNVSGTSHKP
jgi:hypothetical protein